MKVIDVIAYISKEKIDLDKIIGKDQFGKLLRKEPSFLLFEFAPYSYVYIKNFGGIVHFNISLEDAAYINKKICDYSDSELTEYRDNLKINIEKEAKINATFDQLVIPELNLDFVHIISLNLAQSVALFQFQFLSDSLLEKTKRYTTELEQKGRVSLKKRSLMKFIGSTLNLKNRIAEHLYIFETPDLAWDDKDIHRVDQLLKEDLEIRYRYNGIREQLNIVKENLDHFKDVNLHEHSSKLEWIIIILILFEVVHVFIEKIM